MRLTAKDAYINLRIPAEIKERIEHVADDMWCTTSDVGRYAIKNYLKEYEDTEGFETKYHHTNPIF